MKEKYQNPVERDFRTVTVIGGALLPRVRGLYFRVYNDDDDSVRFVRTWCTLKCLRNGKMSPRQWVGYD